MAGPWVTVLGFNSFSFVDYVGFGAEGIRWRSDSLLFLCVVSCWGWNVDDLFAHVIAEVYFLNYKKAVPNDSI